MEDVGAGARLKTWLACSGLSFSYLSVNSCLDFTLFLISYHFWFHIILQTLQTQRAEQSSTFHVKHICSSLMIIYISSSLLVIIYTLAFQERKDSRVPPKHGFFGSQPIRQNALRRKILTETSYSSVHEFQDTFKIIQIISINC